ncbi:AraC family transcriptional regulator [Streptomyces sp. 8L]|uniref:AraC family transcriptional regulator n=1 Tax=Streptomyces sp. 8L TaxID=2877242 RepID=UPI001CD3BBA6|nr:helix-turn-helix domain-containing protein [Streptomyces sp. 8L]MCA1219034.1 helix-turn-helix domain-containing protein [Streptomyces sp. 8L]
MYSERPSRFPGAVVWRREIGPGDSRPVLPDGCMDLLWIDGALSVAGPDTRGHVADAPVREACVGVRMPPGTAPALLGVPAHALRDQRPALADVWSGHRAGPFVRRLRAAADPAAELEAVALDLAAASPAPDPLLRAVADRLAAGCPVAATADAVGLGARQLHRRALDGFGYGPKTLARVLRLQRALGLVRADATFAGAAVRAGYADQAHLARDMRALTGLTLTGYAASLP